MIRLHLKERALSTALIIPVAVVVVALAVLQYRWSKEASEATGVRLADSLQLSMVNWHLDLFRNFSEICLAIRIDPAGEPSGDVNQLVRQLAEWKSAAGYPDLVSNVYLLRPEDREHPALRLDAAQQRFEPDRWPASLVPLRRDLAQVAPIEPADVQAPGRRFPDGFYNFGSALRGWRFEPSIPALLHPIIQRETSEPGWLVVELSNEVIQGRILPDLAHRYFQGTDGLDYQVAVVAGSAPRRVIYSSDSNFGQEEVADADGRMGLFGGAGDKPLASSIFVFHRTSENRGSAAAIGVSWFPLLRDASGDQDWQLLVRHRRGGPLGAFVAGMYRRDLAISFGALLLLVVSMGLLIVTANRAQRLARLQMDFVTAVSHELRTPLTVISSAADNIAQGVVEGDEHVRQYGAVIGHQVGQLSGLVEQILLFASTRKEPERHSLRLLNVSEVIDATLASTEGLIKAADFTVHREIEPNLPPVTGDLVALSQCLQNLIANALKYGRDGRWIGIRAAVGADRAGSNEVQVSISDHGIGIDAAEIPRIFEPFYRSPAVKAAQIHGTGLGLSLARRIAEAMNGYLTATSTPGHGSTFTLHLPCAEQVTASMESPNPGRNVSPAGQTG